MDLVDFMETKIGDLDEDRFNLLVKDSLEAI